MNVFYPPRVHWQSVPLPPVTMRPECTGIASSDPDMLAWEVRFLCVDLLPYSETRLLPAGRVLLKSLEQEGDLSSQRKNEEIRHCSLLFIMLTREILLKDAIYIEELEGPCRLLHLTFRDILFESRAFYMPTTSNLNETGLRAPCADTQEPERFANMLRVFFSVMDAFEAALNVINPLAASDEALRERRHQVSQNFSVVKDLTMGQYRRQLIQKLVQAHPLQRQPTLKRKKQMTFTSRDGRETIIVAPRRVRAEYDLSKAREAYAAQQGFMEAKWRDPREMNTIEDGSEVEDGWDFVDFDTQSCGNLNLIYGKQRGFPRRFLNRFTPVLMKRKE